MSYVTTIGATALAAIAAVIVFEMKGNVRDVEREIASIRRDIGEATWRLQTLKADYAFLTRPERIGRQAAQLGMVPGTATEMVSVEGIARDMQLLFEDKIVLVHLPDGKELALRFKPAKTPANLEAGSKAP
jgi:hypothetical protein